MSWRPLPRIAFAVATYPFSASSPADLPLEIGDELYIIEQGGLDGSWFRGYLVAPPSLLAGLTSVEGQTLEARVFSGIFPKSCVEVREVLGDAGADGQSHNAETNGEVSRPDQANGTSPRRANSTIRKPSVRRPTSNSSMGTTGVGAMGDSPKLNGTAATLNHTSSQRTVSAAGGRNLARNLSHRSISRSQPRSSPAPQSPTPISPPMRNAKRPQAPVPMLKIGDETPTSSSEPLVDEIASCLREWHSKNLHEMLLARRYPILEKISSLVNRLDLARRQLLHDVLTAQEALALREEIVWNLVDGNKMLSNEVIVRYPEQQGRLLTAEDSAIDMTKLQSTMSLLKRPPVFQHDPINLYHLMIDVRSFADSGLTSPTVTMYLCSKDVGEAPKALTESFVLDLPPREEFENVEAAGKYRTLFTDLTSNEIGDASRPSVELYLVIKVQISQAIQRASTSSPRKPPYIEENVSPGRPPMKSFSSDSSGKGGRQSLQWAQKRFNSVRSASGQDPKSPKSPLSPVDSVKMEHGMRATSQETSRPSTQQENHQTVKRNVGVGVMNVKHLFGHDMVTDQHVSIWAPDSTYPHASTSVDGWDDFVRELVTNWDGSFTKLQALDYVHLGLQSFAHPNSADLVAKTPTLLQNVALTQKTQFPGAPTRPRSDIYVKLSHASLPDHGSLSHPERGTVQISSSAELKTVQLTLEVRKRSGERIERCIFPSSNSSGQTAWRTSAVGRGEAWNEMVKLVVEPEDVPEAHLIMSIADAPGFPFALAWMPLWSEDAFIRDGPHKPLLHVYDKVTSSSENGKGAYLDLPWDSKSRDGDTKDETLTGPVATLSLETELCSTTFSQDTTLLGILKWRERPREHVIDLLRRFVFVPEIEVVKLVGDVFEAIFGIMVENSGREDFEDATFDALVTLLGKLHDRRFNMGAFVNVYAEIKFNYPFSTPCLVRSYLRLLANPSDPIQSKRGRAAFKVGRQLLRFIIRARMKLEAKEADIGANTQSTFKNDVRRIFNAFEELMRDRSPILIGSRTLIVQHMHTWLPELRPMFSEDEILQFAMRFVDSCAEAEGKLILYKLVFILNLTNQDIFSNPEIRQRVSNYTISWIDPYWGYQTEPGQWRDQVRLCCSIISKHAIEFQLDDPALFTKAIHSYRSLMAPNQPPKDHLSLMFPTAYPFPSKSIETSTHFDEALTELVALLATLGPRQVMNRRIGSEAERTDLLFESLDVVMSFFAGSAFPKSWLSLYIYHHRAVLQMLETLFGILMTEFIPSPDEADGFNTDLWSKFLSTLLTLVRSDALALETFPEQKRRAVWKIAGDVREEGADLLKRSWEAIGWDSSYEEQERYGLTRLGGFQVQYVPSFVAPIVELCLSVHEGLRNVAVRILQAMIVSEWTLNEDLSVIQVEMVNCFEQLFQSKNVGENLVQKLFVNELLELFGPLAAMPLDPMWQAIKDMITTIDELLELLTAAHSPDITEALRIMNTLQLMNFLRGMHKEDIFIRYVHQLAQVQAKLDYKTEAGLALRLHADLYTWEPTRVEPLADPEYPEQSSFERKEQLYFEMIKFFEESEAWSSVLATYEELAEEYQCSHFDFFKLARTQRAMATVYDTIARGHWQSPRYFRVIYHGNGFLSNLRGKQFIYEGEAGERQSAFSERMLQLHPSAQITLKGDVDDSEGQYIQVSPVSPYRDLNSPIYYRPKVAQPVRDYVASSRPHVFAVTSKRHTPAGGAHNQWIEKSLFTTKETFPTILRRSEIVAMDVVRLSPLQTAVERTSRKTSELSLLERKVNEQDEASVQNLTDAILSSVDPSSTSSVAQYRQLLSQAPGSTDEHDEETPPPSKLEDALQVALLDHVSILKHCLTHYMRADQTQTRAFLFDNLQETFAPEMSILAPVSALEMAVPDLMSSPNQSVADGPTVAPPLLNLTNGDTNATEETLGRPRPLSRISLGFLKTSNQSVPKANGSISGPSAPSEDGGSSERFNQARQGVTASLNNALSPDTTGPKESFDAPSERPTTAASTKSGGRMKKRLSSLGIGRNTSRAEKPKIDGVAEE